MCVKGCFSIVPRVASSLLLYSRYLSGCSLSHDMPWTDLSSDLAQFTLFLALPSTQPHSYSAMWMRWDERKSIDLKSRFTKEKWHVKTQHSKYSNCENAAAESSLLFSGERRLEEVQHIYHWTLSLSKANILRDRSTLRIWRLPIPVCIQLLHSVMCIWSTIVSSEMCITSSSSLRCIR